jgi:hypothetical protein
MRLPWLARDGILLVAAKLDLDQFHVNMAGQIAGGSDN